MISDILDINHVNFNYKLENQFYLGFIIFRVY